MPFFGLAELATNTMRGILKPTKTFGCSEGRVVADRVEFLARLEQNPNLPPHTTLASQMKITKPLLLYL